MLADTHVIRWIGRGQVTRDWLLRCGGGGTEMETGQITEASACRTLLYLCIISGNRSRNTAGNQWL